MRLFTSSPLLSWLPDETLFGLVSRNHVIWGHGQDWRTSEILFGTRHGGTHHDLPNCVGAFAERTAYVLGDSEKIARERTLLKYYGRFLSSEDEQNAVAALCGDSVAHLKYKLGLLTSRFRANHPLKSCELCMLDDFREHGWSYWHLEHQFPGVWWCQRHDLLLRESLLKSTGVERFLWHLPDIEVLRVWPQEIVESVSLSKHRFTSMARTTAELVANTVPGELTSDRLYKTYQHQLTLRGWLTSGGNLRLAEVAASFLEYASLLRALPEFKALPATKEEAVAQVGRLLRPMRGGTHPIRHILLIDWLFGGAHSFLDVVRVPDAQAPSRGMVETSAEEVDDPRKARLRELLVEQGKSARAAASEVGIDTATAMVWAAKLGIQVTRRPKILKDGQRAKLIAMLRTGADKKMVAESMGVSIQTVTQVLRSEVGLHVTWHQARQDQVRQKMREEWQGLLATHKSLGTKLIREMRPDAYSWLYRNDRGWLDRNQPPRNRSPALQGTPRAPWRQRDLDLSSRIEAAALAIYETDKTSRICLGRIVQRVPELQAKLSALDRLPLTSALLKRIVGRRSRSQRDDLLI